MGIVRSEEDPYYNQELEENLAEGKSHLLDHIEPVFSNNLHDQLKTGLISHVLCIAFLQTSWSS